MIEIIKPNINTGYETVDIPDEEVVIEYLKQLESYNFKVINIDNETRDRILSCNKLKEFPEEHDNSIVGYVSDYKGDSFRSSGGLKLSSKTSLGSFIIEDERIIYDPTKRFYEERDSYRYSSSPLKNFYTTASMKDLLLDELRLNRDCFIYTGDKFVKNPLRYIEELQKVSQSELLSYADEVEKGEKLYQKIIRKNY